MTADQRYQEAALALAYSLDDAIKIGGNYTPLLQDGNHLYVSGQVPRVGEVVLITGAVGAGTSLAQAQLGAKICTLRALTLLQRTLGSLERIKAIPRITVYVQSAADFTQQSEVADAASELLHLILGAAGRHSRSAVGVLQLPKNASVEIDLIASIA
jgi:enamine deaminase RidA (YjgF/YER057c/UK114 family)